jgi:nucleoside-diphosphate-sugar epimerase
MTGLPEAVVVFGASGFIGRNIVDALRGRIGKLIGVTGRSPAVAGCDVTVTAGDLGALPQLPLDTIVINVAAVRYDAKTFAQRQAAILSENVAIANTVYGFCADRGIKEVRLASSVAVYPASWTSLDDEQPLDLNAWPNSGEGAYAWSKRWSEICAEIFRRQGGINTITFRLSNPYGRYDETDAAAAHVAAAFVVKALAPGDRFEILGNPANERDFIHAEDVAAVFLESLHRRGQSGTYNLGFGSTTTIRDLALAALRASGKEKQIIVAEAPHGVGVRARVVKADRVRRDFAVPNFATLDQGLGPTMAWYRDALKVAR